MAIQPTDIQPENFKVKLRGREFDCSPPRLSHRIILKKTMPLFDSVAKAISDEEIDIDADVLIKLEKEVDAVFRDLVPGLSGVTLNAEDVIDLITQIITASMPQESREAKETGIKVEKDPKVKRTG